MEVGVLISIGSFIIAFVLAIVQVRTWLEKRAKDRKLGIVEDFKAPAQRDSIIVSGAQEAVLVLKTSLMDTRDDNERLRKRIDSQDVIIAEQEKRIRHLERKLARYENEGSI